MARTNREKVESRIDTDLGAVDVEAMIDDANAWVSHFLANEGLSSSRLEKIETYLACHYITLKDPRLRQARNDDIAETYQRDTQVTEYLRQAVAEDPTGIVRSKFIAQEEAATVTFRTGLYDPD